jgi:hypothetical protein
MTLEVNDHWRPGHRHDTQWLARVWLSRRQCLSAYRYEGDSSVFLAAIVGSSKIEGGYLLFSLTAQGWAEWLREGSGPELHASKGKLLRAMTDLMSTVRMLPTPTPASAR